MAVIDQGNAKHGDARCFKFFCFVERHRTPGHVNIGGRPWPRFINVVCRELGCHASARLWRGCSPLSVVSLCNGPRRKPVRCIQQVCESAGLRAHNPFLAQCARRDVLKKRIDELGKILQNDHKFVVMARNSGDGALQMSSQCLERKNARVVETMFDVWWNRNVRKATAVPAGRVTRNLSRFAQEETRCSVLYVTASRALTLGKSVSRPGWQCREALKQPGHE